MVREGEVAGLLVISVEQDPLATRVDVGIQLVRAPVLRLRRDGQVQPLVILPPAVVDLALFGRLDLELAGGDGGEPDGMLLIGGPAEEDEPSRGVGGGGGAVQGHRHTQGDGTQATTRRLGGHP
ncbi:hypothetical protein D3C79_723120 [compost metagenome]